MVSCTIVSLDVKEGTDVTDGELIQLAMENVTLELNSSLEEDPEYQTHIDGVNLVESEVSSLETYNRTGSGNVCYLEQP